MMAPGAAAAIFAANERDGSSRLCSRRARRRRWLPLRRTRTTADGATGVAVFAANERNGAGRPP